MNFENVCPSETQEHEINENHFDDGLKEVQHDETENAELNCSEYSEHIFSETLNYTTERYKEVYPLEQLIRIDEEKETAVPKTLSVDEYCERFPEMDISVLGHCDSESNIYIKEGPQPFIEHVVIHEALHFCSYRETDIDDKGTLITRCGLRETRMNNEGLYEDSGRGLNEGITELYTLRRLEELGDIKSRDSLISYPESRNYAYALESAVGSSTLEKAYYGGEVQSLKDKFIQLSEGNEDTWNQYLEDINTVEYDYDSDRIREARVRLAINNAVMFANKSQTEN